MAGSLHGHRTRLFKIGFSPGTIRTTMVRGIKLRQPYAKDLVEADPLFEERSRGTLQSSLDHSEQNDLVSIEKEIAKDLSSKLQSWIEDTTVRLP